MDRVLAEHNPLDTYSVGIYTETTNLFVPPKRISRFNKKEFLNTILKIIQSDQTLLDDGKFTLSVGVMCKLTGSGPGGSGKRTRSCPP